MGRGQLWKLTWKGTLNKGKVVVTHNAVPFIGKNFL